MVGGGCFELNDVKEGRDGALFMVRSCFVKKAFDVHAGRRRSSKDVDEVELSCWISSGRRVESALLLDLDYI
ncbi:hypothetical protein HPP92_005938 [Vanilla planifolia]|uniref:Uncharacterized protein n=1 Tax=Vanilla planifolia TaxID=51239 RepID=A0A835RQH7_VANPL|nr:hypothetical protein HPP92_005938 [Vanilla planifolia]